MDRVRGITKRLIRTGVAAGVALVVTGLGSASERVAAAQENPPLDCLQSDEALTYWRAVREEVTENELPADELSLELVDCLGSPDPELRDRIGYEVLTYWLRGEHLTDETRRALLERLSANVREASDDRVLVRSFSALVLSEVLRSDAQKPFMSSEDRATVLNDVAVALERESDFRGLVEELGWVHPVAHMSDVLWRLALHPATDASAASGIVAALRPKIAPTAASYAFNESDRMARVVATLLERSSLSSEAAVAWLSGFEAPHSMESWRNAFQSPAGMAELHNTKLFLRALSDQLVDVEIDAAVREKLDQLVLGFTGLV